MWYAMELTVIIQGRHKPQTDLKRVTRYEYYYFQGNCILMSHQVPVAQNKNGIGYSPDPSSPTDDVSL